MRSNFVRLCLSFIQISALVNILCTSLLQINDECIVGRTKENGTCKFANDCPRVVLETVEQSLYPTLCGFKNGKDLICCPNHNQNQTTTKLVNIESKASTSHRISVQSMNLQ